MPAEGQGRIGRRSTVNFLAMAAEDQLGFSFKPLDRRIWTVRDLIAAVRTQLEQEYTDAWVEGEISNFRAAESGHLYFTLKDQGAQIRTVMFRSSARLLRFRPENGMQVVVRGRVTIYEDRGELQISAEYIEPKGEAGSRRAFRCDAEEGYSGAAAKDRDCVFRAGSGVAGYPQHPAAASQDSEHPDISRTSAG